MKKLKPTKRLALNKTTIVALQQHDLKAVAGGCSYIAWYTMNKVGCSNSCTNVCSGDTGGYCDSIDMCNGDICGN